jgi:aldehyde:ferredoxin oxidoreductase
VFEDPFPEWAELLRPITGWEVTGEELERTARRIVLAKRLFNLREGWTDADDWLPERFLSDGLELDSGRTAKLPAERLRAMIDAYYEARGLHPDGTPTQATCAELGLGELATIPVPSGNDTGSRRD